MGCTYESKPDKWALASVNTYVAATNAPTILFHGSGDLLCPACVSENFYNNLRGVGVDCDMNITAATMRLTPITPMR